MDPKQNSSLVRRRFSSVVIAGSLTILLGGAFMLQPVSARRQYADSPLVQGQIGALVKASRLMKSGKYAQATQVIDGILQSCNDVSKCIFVAQATEGYGHPMNEARRSCLNRAYGLATSREDLILVALKSRQYQFFEVTRQAIASLIANARTVPELYDLAKKSQEVALNDVAHLAMEKAYTGVKDQNAAFAFAEQAKAMGMDDLLRKVIKELIDDEEDVTTLCDLLLKLEGYQMRDQTRYGLRKALDKATSVGEMQGIFEVSKRLNEPDVANRAMYFVRKGKIIQKIKEDRSTYETQLRGWREGVDVDASRSLTGDSGFSGGGGLKRSAPGQPPGSGF